MMRQGAPIIDGKCMRVDIGAINLPGLKDKIQGLVDDAVSKGAKV